MEATLAPVDEPLIDALHLDAPYTIADIGCGGGGTTLEILRRAPAGSVVHGFDISPDSIEAARERTRSEQRAITFGVADVATTTRGPYDRLVSRFGTMFFGDPPAAFANLVRWLVPGGRFAFAVWGPAAENPWTTSVREVVAEFVEMPTQDPDAPGPFRYAEAHTLLTVLDEAGFRELHVHDWRGALALGGGLPAAAAATFALEALSSYKEQLAEVGDAAMTGARESLTSVLRAHERSGAVRMEACVHIVTGARPRGIS